ncbi:hypothetical protein ACFOWM_04050 [Ferruginibacter yonginensis]|uniref:Uncharacterized protein n=1 Tax=Ferruginibacter yonginensis TaxID=1310416 RepID=A0ABV8QQE5_9BACT
MVTTLQLQAQVPIADTVIHMLHHNVSLNIVCKTKSTVTSKNRISIVCVKAANVSFNEALAAFVANDSIVNTIIVDVAINDNTILNKSHFVIIDSLLNKALSVLLNNQHTINIAQPIILIGLNDMAAIVLLQAAHHPTIFNKSMLWFNHQSYLGFVEDFDISLYKQLKGKLFVYNVATAATAATAANINAAIDTVALHSKLVIYNLNDYGKNYPSQKVLQQATNWLLANGNNYIIRPLVTF